ncbi:hypothetical protein GGX14DRAFT_414179 [Mycena pura]|uniref:DUF1682-domain-containing protein n=1 Tax=Mycena pura TaxID=153505 RepID=A0AAD6YSY8_9AGAR|nr:hypothetical protein GGX14DRAFT_414179 [Mycena pura]
MATLTKFLASLTPPPVVNPDEYDGLELFRWRFFVFRPALFKKEAFFLAGALFYLAFFFYGRWFNARKATKWLEAHLSVLESQFSKPQVSFFLIIQVRILSTGPEKNWIQDGYSDFFNFSTGRRNVASLHTVFALRPRHDLLQMTFQTLRTFVDLQYRPQDDLQLDFRLLPGAVPYDFVWGVVSKDELLFVKNNRWDLTFTRTTENPGVPSRFSVMSEFADVTDGVLKAFPLAKILEDSKLAPYIRSLTITDQPRDRPTKPVQPQKHVILSLNVPPASQTAATVDIVAAIFPFIDSLSKVAIRPETKTKLKKIREGTASDIKKEAERDKKEQEAEALEDKKAAKRKAEEERVAKLSAAEQQKILERERKRSIRKSQGKITARK